MHGCVPESDQRAGAVRCRSTWTITRSAGLVAAGTPRQPPDPRSRYGRRHPLGGLVVTAAAAVLTGGRSHAAIGQFAKKVPQATRKRLGIWQRPYSDWCVAPGETTIRMLLPRIRCCGVTRQPCRPAGPSEGRSACLIEHGDVGKLVEATGV